MAANPSSVRDQTGPAAMMSDFAGQVRDDTTPQGATTTRAAAWLSRPGDYLQKAVEDRAWSG